MTAVTKKEIRHSVEEAIHQVLLKFELASPSRKSEKLTGDFSKKLARNIKRDLKKIRSKAEKDKKQSDAKGSLKRKKATASAAVKA